MDAIMERSCLRVLGAVGTLALVLARVGTGTVSSAHDECCWVGFGFWVMGKTRIVSSVKVLADTIESVK